MQRGWRNTETKAVKSVPSPVDGAAEAIVVVEGFSAALVETESDITAAKVRTASAIYKGTGWRGCFIRPPAYGSAVCGYAFRWQRTPRWRSRVRYRARRALQCHLTSHCSPRCEFLFLDIHPCASWGRCENLFAASGHFRM